MLPKAFLFATSKMLIYFQKRFGGVAHLTSIWVKFNFGSLCKNLYIRDYLTTALKEPNMNNPWLRQG
jgi:hypothetical protein